MKVQVSLSMAYPLAECKRKIKSKVDQIAAHVGLICLYNTHEAVNHWLAELAGHLRYVRRYTEAKSGTLPFDLLFELLYTQPLESDRQRLILETDCKTHMVNMPVSGDLSQITKLYHDLSALCLATISIDVARVRTLFEHRGIL